MPNPYPIRVTAQDGVTELSGEATFTNPANQPGGGGSQPSQETLNGAAVNIGNGAGANLTWNTKLSGAGLLDLTTPDTPLAIVAGVYAVTVYVVCGSLTAGGYYRPQLVLDVDAFNAFVTADSPGSTVPNSAPRVALSLVSFIPANGKLQLSVFNQDGVNAVDFNIGNAIVQLL